jgi:hypothetical protein
VAYFQPDLNFKGIEKGEKMSYSKGKEGKWKRGRVK